MELNQRLFELERTYESCISDITTLQTKLAYEEDKLFQCQKEMKQIKEAGSVDIL